MNSERLIPSKFIRGSDNIPTERKSQWIHAQSLQRMPPPTIPRLSKLKFLADHSYHPQISSNRTTGHDSMSRVFRSHIQSVANEPHKHSTQQMFLVDTNSDWNAEMRPSFGSIPAADAEFRTTKTFTVNQPRHTLTAGKSRHNESGLATDDNSQRKIFTSFSTRRRIKSEQRFRSTNTNTNTITSNQNNHKLQFEDQDPVRHRQVTLDLHKLRTMVTNSKMFKRRVINAFHIVRQGIRWKLSHCFVEIAATGQNQDSEQLKNMLKDLRKGLHYSQKTIYLFHLNREPIGNLKEIHRREYSIFVDRMPKLQLGLDMYFQLNEQINVVQNTLKEIEIEFGVYEEEDLVPLYRRSTSDKQKAGANLSVQQLVDQLIHDPTTEIDLGRRELPPEQVELGQINEWYDEGIKQFSDQKTNAAAAPTYELKSIINEKSGSTPLSLARKKLENKVTPFFKVENPHKYRLHPLTVLMDVVHHENPPLPSNDKIARNIQKISHDQKAIYRELTKKNKELFTQNIPYIVDKYKISRAEAHHLYTLYKSLEQISAARVKEKVSSVLKSGVDRATFNEGMTGLGINISDQIVKNICRFDDFINWPQFLKIMSISASKTPEEKLRAILQYVRDNQGSETLKKVQLENMVTASLKRILGNEQDQRFFEMRDYFIQLIYKEVDKEGTGKIYVEKLKDRILKNKDTNDLISFLFLSNGSD